MQGTYGPGIIEFKNAIAAINHAQSFGWCKAARKNCAQSEILKEVTGRDLEISLLSPPTGQASLPSEQSHRGGIPWCAYCGCYFFASSSLTHKQRCWSFPAP